MQISRKYYLCWMMYEYVILKSTCSFVIYNNFILLVCLSTSPTKRRRCRDKKIPLTSFKLFKLQMPTVPHRQFILIPITSNAGPLLVKQWDYLINVCKFQTVQRFRIALNEFRVIFHITIRVSAINSSRLYGLSRNRLIIGSPHMHSF